MKKLILLSERLPFPPTSGTKNLLYNYCKILHEKLGLEVVNISFLEQEEDVVTKPEFISKTYVLPNPSTASKLKNIAWKTFLKHEYPLQVSLFWDPKIKVKVDEIVQKEQPDFVISDFIRTTEYLKDFDGYKIADLQDLLSLRYERQLNVELSTINPYGAYLFRFPRIIQDVLTLSCVKKAVMNLEISLLKKFEMNVGRTYDRVMFVAKNEGEKFDTMLGKKKSLIAPLGVDYDFFSENLALKKKDNSIAFMGALNVAHNENGIIHFIEKCMPEIQKRIPDVTLYIVGGGVTERLKQYASEHIVFTGRVPDVRVAIGECEVFICPLQFGSGIKTKNLEAMAMGMPVVTTPIGAENIDAQNEQDWLVACSDEEFIKSVLNLLMSNQINRDILGQNAQKFVQSNFTWDRTEQAFRSVLVNEKENLVDFRQ